MVTFSLPKHFTYYMCIATSHITCMHVCSITVLWVSRVFPYRTWSKNPCLKVLYTLGEVELYDVHYACNEVRPWGGSVFVFMLDLVSKSNGEKLCLAECSKELLQETYWPYSWEDLWEICWKPFLYINSGKVCFVFSMAIDMTIRCRISGCGQWIHESLFHETFVYVEGNTESTLVYWLPHTQCSRRPKSERGGGGPEKLPSVCQLYPARWSLNGILSHRFLLLSFCREEYSWR